MGLQQIGGDTEECGEIFNAGTRDHNGKQRGSIGSSKMTTMGEEDKSKDSDDKEDECESNLEL